MAMTSDDYRKQGAEHFAAGVTYASGSMNTHEGSWQRRAFAEGYNERAAEHAKSSGKSAFDSQTDRILANHPKLASDRRVDKILDGYLKAAQWSTSGTHPRTGEEVEHLMDFGIAESVVGEQRRECTRFYLAAGPDLGAFVDLYPSRVSAEHDPWEAIGHDLWLTRNGHGVGFWDRNMGRVGERLTALCGHGKAFGPVDAYVGDDELVYFI